MQRVRVKICGVTCVEDALQASRAGADAIGLVFFSSSPRNVSIHTAREICAAVPPFVTIVGLFVNESQAQIERVCKSVPIGLLQFHGDEEEAECSLYKVPYIKAIKVRTADDITNAEKKYPSAQAILADTYKKGVAGGTGMLFDWSLLPSSNNTPLILAGGLNPDNVRSAVNSVAPYAVDVSGGVEREKGLKDHLKVSRFINEVLRD